VPAEKCFKCHEPRLRPEKIILNGITTISTDFQMMGEKAAQLILEQSTEHVEIPFYLKLRSSL
jgi:DNA-binding LacI/PurR family transcriptional regulator